MKKIDKLLIATFILMVLFVCSVKANITPLYLPIDLLVVSCTLESNCNPLAKRETKNELALGKHQIREIMVKEHNRLFGTTFTHECVLNSYVSDIIFTNMSCYYGTRYLKLYGYEPSIEYYLARWNAGRYWQLQSNLPHIQRYYCEILKN
jgi:hypothetical protein